MYDPHEHDQYLEDLKPRKVPDYSVETDIRGNLLLDAADSLGLPAADVLEMVRAHLQFEQRRVLEHPTLLKRWKNTRRTL